MKKIREILRKRDMITTLRAVATCLYVYVEDLKPLEFGGKCQNISLAISTLLHWVDRLGSLNFGIQRKLAKKTLGCSYWHDCQF
jgi:fatty acid-binding protein DegV